MKKSFLLMALVCLFPLSAVAQIATSPATAPAYVGNAPSLFFHDGYRTPIAVTASPGQRLPVDVTGISIGSLTVDAVPVPVYEDAADATSPARIDDAQRVLVNIGSQTVNTASSPFYTDENLGNTSSTSVVLISGTGYQIPLITNARQISISATGSFQVMLGSTTFQTNQPELPNGFNGPVQPWSIVTVKTAATATYGVIYQVGR